MGGAHTRRSTRTALMCVASADRTDARAPRQVDDDPVLRHLPYFGDDDSAQFDYLSFFDSTDLLVKDPQAGEARPRQRARSGAGNARLTALHRPARDGSMLARWAPERRRRRFVAATLDEVAVTDLGLRATVANHLGRASSGPHRSPARRPPNPLNGAPLLTRCAGNAAVVSAFRGGQSTTRIPWRRWPSCSRIPTTAHRWRGQTCDGSARLSIVVQCKSLWPTSFASPTALS